MSVENSALAKGRSRRSIRSFAVMFLTLIFLASAGTAVFAGKSTLGDYVWIDYNDNDIPDDGNTGINGVVVHVYKDDGNGIFSPTLDGPMVAISTTINEPMGADGDNTLTGQPGFYDTSVNDGDHWVHLPASNFGPGGPLEGYTYTGSGLVLPDGSIVLLRNVPIQGDIDTADFGFIPYDWGDLPDGVSLGAPQYNTSDDPTPGPSHVITPGLRIGVVVDAETDGQPSGAADGDDTARMPDDEDGVTFPPIFVAGASAPITVSVVNTTASNATLYGFIDWNGDGDFLDSVEKLTVVIPPNTTQATLTYAVPVTADLEWPVGARFRLSTDDTLGADSPARDGEVEDYLIQVVGYDWGDLPDGISPTSPDYHTDSTGIVGPSHRIINTLSDALYMGSTVDAEVNGQPTATANGDDTMTSNDEDGIAAFPQFVAGSSTVITVSVFNNISTTAILYAFIDWNGDGDFADLNEQPTPVNVPAFTNGNIAVNVTVPLTASTTSDLGARFRFSTDALLGAYGPASDGEVEDYLIQVVGYDWGDLPDGVSPTSPDYHTDSTGIVGPSHLIDADLRLGAIEDAETDGQPNGTATGDDATTSDDEDAVTFPQFVAGASTVITVSAYNTTGVAATLYGFIDWNADGDFGDMNEQVSVPVPNATNGNSAVNVTVPLTASTTSDLGARFRFSTDALLGAYGPASDGEVEDYLIQVVGYDWGDLPDGNATTSPDYHTDMSGIVGPSHLIDADLRLGAIEDAETDGQPTATANGDDAATSDDEDGVTLPSMFVAGSSTVITVSAYNTTGMAARLYGFIDWNADGDFGDMNEQVSGNVPNGTNGPITLTVTVPLTASVTSDLGARFRLSTDALLGAYGPASDGEVEDYLIQVERFDLALRKVAANTTVEPGKTVTFTLEVFNQGTLPAYNISVSDHFTPAFVFTPAVGLNMNWLAVSATHLSRTIPGPLMPGSSASIQLVLQVPSSYTITGIITNTAEINAADDDTNPVNTPPTDVDSTPDTMPNNDGPVADNVINNINGDQDDHDPAPVLVTYNPTAVAIAKSDVRESASGMEVSWATESEADLIGFNLYRLVNGQMQQVNSSMIAAQKPGQADGANYQITDRAASGQHPTYLLEIISSNGEKGYVSLGGNAQVIKIFAPVILFKK